MKSRPRPRQVGTPMSARKSAPISAGGVNLRRLMASQQGSSEHKREDEEAEKADETNEAHKEVQEPVHQCSNPFCNVVLTNRYTMFCEDKPMCQRYRALKLQCLANAQAKEDEEDTKPLVYFLKKKRQNQMEKKQNEETFAIPRKNKVTEKINEHSKAIAEMGKKSSRETKKMAKKKRKAEKKMELKRKLEEKREKKKQKKVENMKEKAATSAPSSSLRIEIPMEEIKSISDRSNKRTQLQTPRSVDAESRNVGKAKKRRLNQLVSPNISSSRSATPTGTSTTWKIPKTKPTAAQAMKNMEVELVALGGGLGGGGGRYVQSGNRSTVQSLRSIESRPRPPKLSKFAVPAPISPSVSALQLTESIVETPTRVEEPLPPPLSHTSVTTAVSQSSGPNTATIETSTTSVTKETASDTMEGRKVQRITAADYMKNRKDDTERWRSNERMDQEQSRESMRNQSDDHSLEYQPDPVVRIESERYYRRNSAPSLVFKEQHRTISRRRPHIDIDSTFPKYHMDRSVLEYQDGSESYYESFQSGPPPSRNYSPFREYYQPRQEESSSFNENYGYTVAMHVSPTSSPAEKPMIKETVGMEPPRQERPRSSRSHELKQDQDGEIDAENAVYSYHEGFLLDFLSVYMNKFPKSLEPVLNVTKKPRKMNWYIQYVERIEQLGRQFDLRVKLDGLKAIVTVRGREWLTLRSKSTVILYQNVIKTLRAEAVWWLDFYTEMEKTLTTNRDTTSASFLRVWHACKGIGHSSSSSKEVNYFCGARLHHWNFVVGKIEIGSGSHEEKREAFRLATVAAFDFVLNIGRGTRGPRRRDEVKQERSSDRKQRGSDQTLSRAREGEEEASTDAFSSVEVSSTTGLQSCVEPSSFPITVERKKPAAVLIPATDQPSSQEASETSQQSDAGEEMDSSETGSLYSSASRRKVGAKAADSDNLRFSESKSPNQCMMCEVIRMRKSNGELCLRCQQMN